MGFVRTNGGMPARRSTAAHVAVRQRHEQLAGGRDVTRISSPLACLLEHLSWRLTGSVEAATVRRQRGGGERGILGPVGNAVRKRPQGMRAMLRGVDGGEAEWGGWMGTVTQGGNSTASIRARGRDERIGR
jgi:hypothetical protein